MAEERRGFRFSLSPASPALHCASTCRPFIRASTPVPFGSCFLSPRTLQEERTGFRAAARRGAPHRGDPRRGGPRAAQACRLLLASALSEGLLEMGASVPRARGGAPASHACQPGLPASTSPAGRTCRPWGRGPSKGCGDREGKMVLYWKVINMPKTLLASAAAGEIARRLAQEKTKLGA